MKPLLHYHFLVDKSTSKEATRVLFHPTCISTSMFSLDRIAEISDRPRLANPVRGLEMHRLAATEVDFKKFPGMEHVAERASKARPCRGSLASTGSFPGIPRRNIRP